jgi:hypothetical protein
VQSAPAVTQANIQSTICSYGYTETVRPPESITEPEKQASLAAYGDYGPLHDYEFDHLVPLSLGGAPTTPGTSGQSRGRRRTRGTSSRIGCGTWSAPARCHWLRLNDGSPQTGSICITG